MDFAGVAAIVALILAMVVPLFFLMRTQKQGDEQEEKNKTAELAKEIARKAPPTPRRVARGAAAGRQCRAGRRLVVVGGG